MPQRFSLQISQKKYRKWKFSEKPMCESEPTVTAIIAGNVCCISNWMERWPLIMTVQPQNNNPNNSQLKKQIVYTRSIIYTWLIKSVEKCDTCSNIIHSTISVFILCIIISCIQQSAFSTIFPSSKMTSGK